MTLARASRLSAILEDVPGGDNYAVTDNLRARISIHGYAVRPGWEQWLFEREAPPQEQPARILDIGCGLSGLWTENRRRISPRWALTLADSSPAMVEHARVELGVDAEYAIADITTLPFEDGAFDVVLANHMLYHVDDRPRAFAEIVRVLTPGGAFRCSTNGRGHLEELIALRPPSGLNAERFNEAFGLETGPPQLKPFFTQIAVERFDNRLAVPAVGPVLEYIRSSEAHRDGDDLTAVREIIEQQIRDSGEFSITTRPGVITCISK